MKKTWFGVLALTAALALPAAPALAESETVALTGIEDFDMAVVFRPLFATLPSRNAVIAQARWQINGDEVGPFGTLGIFAVFDVDSSLLFTPGDNGPELVGIDAIEFLLPPAVNLDTGAGGIANGGDLSIFFTTSDVDVLDPASGIIFDNGGGTDPTGLGDQFENLTLLSSAQEEAGIRDVERLIVPVEIEGFEAALLERINAGENIRFLIASQTAGFTSNFGTGNEDTSPTFNFFGQPPVVSFTLNIEEAAAPAPLPTPVAVPLLGPMGLILLGLILFGLSFRQLRAARAQR
ncbi:MAG: hypothetical protein ACXIUM_11500 [Wenzhouxiangella sp.]